MADYEDILYEVRDRVGLITLDRPDKLNAWTGPMERSVKQAINAAANDDSVRVIVITGAGRGFCAGADMSILQDITPETGEDRSLATASKDTGIEFGGELGPDVIEDFQGRFGYFMRCPKPIIAAINGPAAGLGFIVPLYCDMRFASSSAKFTTAFAQRGLIAEHGISWLLPHLVGPSNALDLLMSARKISGEEAARMGLVNQCFDEAHFMDNVMAYARQISETVSPRSMAVMKAQVWKAMFQDFNTATRIGDDEMLKSFSSADFKEGIAHFVEKRAPNFTGR